MKKRNLKIVGPIAYGGGRFLEVNHMADSLKDLYDIEIISTESHIYKASPDKNVLPNEINTLDKIIYNRYFDLKILSILSYFKNAGKREYFSYVNNRLAKKLFFFEKKRTIALFHSIKEAEIVILPMQLTSGFLPEIIEFCEKLKISCIVRTTGTIKNIPTSLIPYLEKVNLFIHHSQNNANRLHQHIKAPYTIIDQSATMEKSLLKLPIKIIYPLRFGFLGRFSKEKGGYELASYFSKNDQPFIIGGDGPQKELILKMINNQKNCKYLGGYVSDDKKAEFFDQIDVLIISSHEETGPYTGIEAMAAGKIIFSTRVGAMEDRLQDTANDFWFEVDELDSLSNLIERINQLSNEELLNICRKNRDRYCKNYSRAIISKSYLEECKNLLKQDEK